MAKELDIAMTFETKPSDTITKSCEDGGCYKSFPVTTAKVSGSWYQETPEGGGRTLCPRCFRRFEFPRWPSRTTRLSLGAEMTGGFCRSASESVAVNRE
jgi:hypothetical protein